LSISIFSIDTSAIYTCIAVTGVTAASWSVAYLAPGTTYTFSTGLTNTSGTVTNNLSTGVSGGQTAIGDINAGGNLTLSSTSNSTKGYIGITNAPRATANYGSLSIGSGAFDGSTSGKFVGSSSGTSIAVNEASGYAGNLMDLQVAGLRVLSVGYVSSLKATVLTGGSSGIILQGSADYNNWFFGQAGNTSFSGVGNMGYGGSALASISSGNNNSFYGSQSGMYITTSDGNVGIGSQAGRFISGGSTHNITPSNSTYIGYQTYPLADAQTNQTVIGYACRI